jgi:hypothetical protein
MHQHDHHARHEHRGQRWPQRRAGRPHRGRFDVRRPVLRPGLRPIPSAAPCGHRELFPRGQQRGPPTLSPGVSGSDGCNRPLRSPPTRSPPGRRRCPPATGRPACADRPRRSPGPTKALLGRSEPRSRGAAGRRRPPTPPSGATRTRNDHQARPVAEDLVSDVCPAPSGVASNRLLRHAAPDRPARDSWLLIAWLARDLIPADTFVIPGRWHPRRRGRDRGRKTAPPGRFRQSWTLHQITAAGLAS